MKKGKLLVYTSEVTSNEQRTHSVSVAAGKLARLLELTLEFITLKENFDSIYVYYKKGEEDPIPIYYNKNGEHPMQKIYKNLREMMFVLSFHPGYSTLKPMRKEIVQFS